MKNEGYRMAPVRSHWPVLTVDYAGLDAKSGYGDARYIDIGQSTWSKEDFSAKIWRWADNGNRWSRLGEELPLSRVFDLAILVTAAVMGRSSILNEFRQNEDQTEVLSNYLAENMQVFGPKMDELRRLLRVPTTSLDNRKPNLFSFATSELSQDAMFSWLLSWARPECAIDDYELHDVAVKFVCLLTGYKEIQIDKINVGRQWEHIDVWAEINDDIFLIIEDKTGTTIHDDQLARYKESVEREYPDRTKCYAYVKTGNEPGSILKLVSEVGYRIILRKDIIDCLEGYTGENVLLRDYRDHLKAIETDVQSYKSLPARDWSWGAWEGFYKELETKVEIDNWSYVANPSGGFLAAWWHWVPLAKNMGEMYLQFEQQDLCFKICPRCNREERSVIRNRCHRCLMEKAKGRYPEIVRPQRFGAGEYMTIGKVCQDDLFGVGVVNLDTVVSRLRQYEALVDECSKMDV